MPLGELLEQHSTPKVQLVIVSSNPSQIRNAEEVVFEAFSQPFYKLHAWMAEGTGSSKNAAASDMVRWSVNFGSAQARETGYILCAVNRENSQLLGAALVSKPLVYQANPIIRLFQHLYIDVFEILRVFFWTVGLPPAFSKLRTYVH
jgi:hypothetical protein